MSALVRDSLATPWLLTTHTCMTEYAQIAELGLFANISKNYPKGALVAPFATLVSMQSKPKRLTGNPWLDYQIAQQDRREREAEIRRDDAHQLQTWTPPPLAPIAPAPQPIELRGGMQTPDGTRYVGAISAPATVSTALVVGLGIGFVGGVALVLRLQSLDSR